ncbi:hypothetical protein [Holdemanella sp.]|uniref:hypothetical protein n=1 Tax=Holdemanella sp. TaxID=1971762 RepID=UPI003AEFF131
METMMLLIALGVSVVAALPMAWAINKFGDDEIAKGIIGVIVSVILLIGGIRAMITINEQYEQEQATTEQAAEQTQWSDWKETEDIFLLQEIEEDTYVVEQDDGTYVCKALKYSLIGETEATYKVIEENDDITVSFLELMEGEKPYGEVLERTSTDDETQTMYVFHVPATEN